jgi:hypothetical protein
MLDSLDTLIAFVLIMLVVSLIITIAVQMTSAALNLRGLNLLKGLSSTFAVIAPELNQSTKKLARLILKGPLLSDSFLPDWPVVRWWRHSAAIRPDEVFDAIHRIATGRRPASSNLQESAQTLLVALGMDEKTINDAAAKIRGAQEIAESFAEKTANDAVQSLSDEKVREQVQAALESAKARLSSYGIAAAYETKAAAGSIDAAYQKFKYWTEICQERAQQWFTMHTRIATIFFALVFASWLQLDTVDIFKFVSSNRAVRDKLVAQSTVIASQAEKALGDSPNVLQEAYEGWRDQSDENVKTAVASIKIGPNDTREKLSSRIDQALTSVSEKEALLKSFNDTVDKTVTDSLKKQTSDYAAVKRDFDNTGFDLFPKNGGGRWGNRWHDGWKRHLWGVLFSVGFLSLGAPFWYNALKNLSSLRSTVAQNISNEQKQAQEQADGGGSRPSRVLPS